MMIIAASRRFRDGATCFVGVGMPSAAACVARTSCARNVVLVYESGAIGAKPSVPPLSVADPQIAETADLMVSIPEMFSYWVQGGRIDMAIIGAGQLDRYGNVNSTVIGHYARPKVRMPGAGGAPEVAAHAREVVIITRQSLRAFVPELDFLSTRGERVSAVVTDMGEWEKDPGTGELILAALHPSVTVEEVRAESGWVLRSGAGIRQTPPPSAQELISLRGLNLRAASAL